jgi:prepilin-type N-terminal cleavage/methylation domain-containing protein
MRHHVKSSQCGFTLIELMVVVVIVAIFAQLQSIRLMFVVRRLTSSAGSERIAGELSVGNLVILIYGLRCRGNL